MKRSLFRQSLQNNSSGKEPSGFSQARQNEGSRRSRRALKRGCMVRQESLQRHKAIRGKLFRGGQGFYRRQPEKKAILHLFRLEDKRTLGLAGKDPPPDPVVIGFMIKIEMAAESGLAQAQLFGQFTLGGKLVGFPGQDHTAGGDIKVAWIEIFAHGSPLDKDFLAPVENQDVAGPVDETALPHHSPGNLRHLVVLFVYEQDYFIGGIHFYRAPFCALQKNSISYTMKTRPEQGKNNLFPCRIWP